MHASSDRSDLRLHIVEKLSDSGYDNVTVHLIDERLQRWTFQKFAYGRQIAENIRHGDVDSEYGLASIGQRPNVDVLAVGLEYRSDGGGKRVARFNLVAAFYLENVISFALAWSGVGNRMRVSPV